MRKDRSFVAGAAAGSFAGVVAAALFAGAWSHSPAAADPPTLPNAAAQRNETVAELRAIREAIEKQTALLEERLPKPKLP